nr:type II secretion system protein N [uncultured Desulfobulbus sp.]
MRTIVIRLLVITLLVYAAVQLWYGQVEKRLQKQVPRSTVVEQAKEAPAREKAVPELSADDEVQAVLARNIFQASAPGEESVEKKSSESDIDQLAPTQLNLSLLGTVTGKQDDARAIIRDDKTRLEDLYRVGSEIQGALVNRITRGKVVLLVNGREEVLVIKDRDGGGGSGGAAPANRPIAMGDPDEGMSKPVPQAVPRRRISFRSPTPKPPVAAPQKMTAGQEQVDPPDAAVQEPPPPPEEEVTASGIPEEEQVLPPPEEESEQAVEMQQQ